MSIVLGGGLGPGLMGDYSYLLWALRVLTAIATLGWALATVRYTAEAYARGERERAWGFVRFFMRRQLVTTVLVVAGVMAVLLTGVQPPPRVPFVVLPLLMVPLPAPRTHTPPLFPPPPPHPPPPP